MFRSNIHLNFLRTQSKKNFISKLHLGGLQFVLGGSWELIEQALHNVLPNCDCHGRFFNKSDCIAAIIKNRGATPVCCLANLVYFFLTRNCFMPGFTNDFPQRMWHATI